ncbi:unnamed protein product, partial [Heterosigma akashiwo]
RGVGLVVKSGVNAFLFLVYNCPTYQFDKATGTLSDEYSRDCFPLPDVVAQRPHLFASLSMNTPQTAVFAEKTQFFWKQLWRHHILCGKHKESSSKEKHHLRR